MTSIRTVTLAIPLLFAMAAMAGCVVGASGGQLAFYVKDAPADELDSVFVTFSRVDIHQAKAYASATETLTTVSTHDLDEDEADDDEDDSPRSKWITIVNTTHTVDLKAFTGDARAFLGDANVSAGKYTQIRIYVDRAYGLINGTEVNITVPSGALKIVRPWTVPAGGLTEITVDFDLEKSILKTGKGEYRLRPVLKVVVEHKEKEKDDEDDDEEDDLEARDEDEGRGRPTNPGSQGKGKGGKP